LGVSYLGGDGVARNFKKALFWIQRAAQQGDAKAQWNLGALYISGGDGLKQDLKNAFAWCQKSADQGFIPALATLGVLYARLKNPELAIHCWSKAADQGDPEAQYNLAMMYLKGEGTERESGRAFEWLLKAAVQDVVQAQSRLGLMYATGEGVAVDPIEAHKWFIIASEKGDKASQTNRERSETLIGVAQLAEGRRRASEWKNLRKS
jgi:TPR repeat protein